MRRKKPVDPLGGIDGFNPETLHRSGRKVADRGMISKQTMAQLSERNIRYILGARLRNVKEIREAVLSRGGRYREIHGERSKEKDLSPLKLEQVLVDERRYIVCHNEEQARKDRADRERLHSGGLRTLALGRLGEKNFAIRTPPVGDAGRAIQAVGVALGPSVRLV